MASLYEISIRSVVNQDKLYLNEFRSLPDVVQCDVYHQLYLAGKFDTLNAEMCDIEALGKALRAGNQRMQLYCPFQSLMDHGYNVSTKLADEFFRRCQPEVVKRNSSESSKLIGLALSVGGFLVETGWYNDAESILRESVSLFDTRILCHRKNLLTLLTRLLQVQTANCKFVQAKNTFDDAMELVYKLKRKGEKVANVAALYGEKCSLLFALSQYNEAYGCSLKALQEVSLGLPVKIVVDILRQASKACVVKRKFNKAETLIKQALFLSRQHFGDRHPKYADTLIDYGFYLLNVDSIRLSVQVYKAAFHIREQVFGSKNLHVATAHEDLAYALYVQEYSTGNFEEAKVHAEVSIDIITRVLPEDHLLLASSKRVKALILEEIAIDCQDFKMEQQNLLQAQSLHLSSLELARKAFGENNVQTAKHYGNLGRLYQSMKKFKEAEEMHKKAIEIKETILGNEDYEVALSLGHLASLYNYDMERYDKAEELYLRSIEIGRKLFGDGYSGLEYDYRGLINLYDSIDNIDSMERYHRILTHWKEIRENKPPASLVHNNDQDPWPTSQFIRQFLSQPD